MPELMEPTSVARPGPTATWNLVGTGYNVRRGAYTVEVLDGSRVILSATPGQAAKLGAALSAAADWTDDEVVDATIVDDDRPRIEYRWVVEGLSQTRPPWMTDAAARTLAEDVAGWLAHCTPVVIVRDGEVWLS